MSTTYPNGPIFRSSKWLFKGSLGSTDPWYAKWLISNLVIFFSRSPTIRDFNILILQKSLVIYWIASFLLSTPRKKSCSEVAGIVIIKTEVFLSLIIAVLDVYDLVYVKAFIVRIYKEIIWLKIFSDSG